MEGFRPEDMHAGVLIVDDALEIRAASDRFLHDFGCTFADIEGIELTELVAASDRRTLVSLDRAFSQASITRIDLGALLEVGEVQHLARLLIERRGARWHAFVECIDGPNNLVFELVQDARRWSTVLESSSEGLLFLDVEARITDHNARALELLDLRSGRGVLVGEEALIMAQLPALLADEVYAGLLACVDATLTGTNHAAALELHGRKLEFDGRPLFMPTRGLTGYVIALRDVTDRHQAEAARLASQREAIAHQAAVITAQQAAIRALSAPRIPITKHLSVVPLVGEIDRERMAEITHELLEGLARAGTRAVILDITGVPQLDEGAIAGLLGASRALRMIGVRALLTGVSPNMAQLLASSDFSTRELEVRATLEDAIASIVRKS